MTDHVCLWGTCMSMDTRPYKDGWYCQEHTPAKRAGREEPPSSLLKPEKRGRRSYSREYREQQEAKNRKNAP